MKFVFLRERSLRIFPLLFFLLSVFWNNAVFAFDGKVEATIYPLTQESKKSENNPLKFVYQGERFDPPLNLINTSLNHAFTGTREYHFLVEMLDTIKTKDAVAFKELWAKNEKTPDLYLESPDVWDQFKDFIKTSPNIYLVNKIRYGKYTVLQIMMETKAEKQRVYRFKSYVIKKEGEKFVLTDDVVDDPGYKFILLYSTYMSTEYSIDK